MLNKFEKIINNKKIDYCDIRWEDNSSVKITYHGKELIDITQANTQGGLIRVLNKGGLGISSFNSILNTPESLSLAEESALLTSKNTSELTNFADTEPVKDEIKITPSLDPRKISLEEKKQLLQYYNDLILSSPKISNTEISYNELYWHKFFVTNKGTQIIQEQMITQIAGKIFSQKNGLIQQVRLNLGGDCNFQKLLNRQKSVEKQIKLAQELLEAEPAKAGSYTVILDPEIAGVFIHEAFGHFSEADLVMHNPSLLEKMKIGADFGKPLLNVIDNADLTDKPGGYIYDDEGVKGRKTYLIKEGVLAGRLHNKKTAHFFKEPLSGNCRAENFNFAPVIRMSNIYIDNGDSSLEDLINSVKSGLYIIGAKGGQTSGDQFTFGSQAGFLIENGKLTHMVRDVNLSGNLFVTLQNITAAANDLTFSESGGCGKSGQLLLKSGVGSPHIKIEQITAGGR